MALPGNKRCNICGNPLDEWDLQEDFTIHTVVGYGSKYDLSEVDLRMCCACFDAIVDTCKISPLLEGEQDCGYGTD